MEGKGKTESVKTLEEEEESSPAETDRFGCSQRSPDVI